MGKKKRSVKKHDNRTVVVKEDQKIPVKEARSALPEDIICATQAANKAVFNDLKECLRIPAPSPAKGCFSRLSNKIYRFFNLETSIVAYDNAEKALARDEKNLKDAQHAFAIHKQAEEQKLQQRAHDKKEELRLYEKALEDDRNTQEQKQKEKNELIQRQLDDQKTEIAKQAADLKANEDELTVKEGRLDQIIENTVLLKYKKLLDDKKAEIGELEREQVRLKEKIGHLNADASVLICGMKRDREHHESMKQVYEKEISDYKEKIQRHIDGADALKNHTTGLDVEVGKLREREAKLKDELRKTNDDKRQADRDNVELRSQLAQADTERRFGHLIRQTALDKANEDKREADRENAKLRSQLAEANAENRRRSFVPPSMIIDNRGGLIAESISVTNLHDDHSKRRNDSKFSLTDNRSMRASIAAAAMHGSPLHTPNKSASKTKLERHQFSTATLFSP